MLHGRSWSGNAPSAACRCASTARGARPLARGRTCTARTGRAPGCAGAVHWRPPAAGEYALLARATDATGATQPDTVPPNAGGYQFWAVVRHPGVTAVDGLSCAKKISHVRHR